MGHPIIMGRKTFESIGRPLPGRTCIIVTHQPGYTVKGAIVVNSITEALEACSRDVPEHVAGSAGMERKNFVIGGAEIFHQALPMCDRLYITEIQRDFEGDVLFPEFNRDEWIEVSREKHMDDSGLEYHFVVLDRKTGPVKNGMRGMNLGEYGEMNMAEQFLVPPCFPRLRLFFIRALTIPLRPVTENR